MRVENICFIPEGNTILDNVSFELKKGDLVGLIGPSAGGKSVLMKIMARVLMPTSGRIINDKKISLCFQEGALFDSMTVYENLSFPLLQENLSKEEIHSKIVEILDKVGLLHAIQKFPAQLSGGMKKRISLARAFITEPDILLLDDPTAGLDPVASNVIMDLIKSCHTEENITLVVSHDLRRLFPVVNRVLALFDGKIIFDDKCTSLCNADSGIKSFVSCRYDING